MGRYVPDFFLPQSTKSPCKGKNQGKLKANDFTKPRAFLTSIIRLSLSLTPKASNFEHFTPLKQTASRKERHTLQDTSACILIKLRDKLTSCMPVNMPVNIA
eukprot:1196323-Prorocentrum_minimum.AAC.7